MPEDLIEEVARITGYDKITPAMLCEALPRQNPEPAFRLKRKIKRLQRSVNPKINLVDCRGNTLGQWPLLEYVEG